MSGINIFTRIRYKVEDFIQERKEASINRKYDRVIGKKTNYKPEKKKAPAASFEPSEKKNYSAPVNYDDTKKLEEEIRRRKEEEEYYRKREEEDRRLREEAEERRRREKD